MKEERDKEICRLYSVENLTHEDIGDRYNLKRQRIQQILKQNGLDRTARTPIRSERDAYVGLNVTEEVKEALKAEAIKRGISVSQIGSQTLKEMLVACGYPLEAAKITLTETTHG